MYTPDELVPWQPITDKVDIAIIGKCQEELSVLGKALARCLIQGIDESDPETGQHNRAWVCDGIADVFASAKLVAEHLGLDSGKIRARAAYKKKRLVVWQQSLGSRDDDGEPLP